MLIFTHATKLIPVLSPRTAYLPSWEMHSHTWVTLSLRASHKVRQQAHSLSLSLEAVGRWAPTCLRTFSSVLISSSIRPSSGSVTHFLLLPCLRDLLHPLEISVASILQRSTHIPLAPSSPSPLILPITTLPHLGSCTSLVLIIHIIKCLHKLPWNISLPFHGY